MAILEDSSPYHQLEAGYIAEVGGVASYEGRAMHERLVGGSNPSQGANKSIS